MIQFVNDGETGFVATDKEISFIIKDRITGPFPNQKSVLLLLIELLEGSFEKGEPDQPLMIKLSKEIRKYKK